VYDGPLSGVLDEPRLELTVEGDGVQTVLQDGGCRVTGGGDLNGDGVQDLLISKRDHRDDLAAVLVITGPGFNGEAGAAPGRIVGHASGEFGAVTVLDWDGDGQDDLAVAQEPYLEEEASTWVFLGPITSERSTLGSDLRVLSSSDDDIGRSVVAGDLTGDGLPDLVSLGGWEEISAVFNVGL
jgi:hypothetical protein